MKRSVRVVLVAALISTALPVRAFAAVSVSPAVVNIATFGPSTVFLSYRTLSLFTPGPAAWCSAIQEPGDNCCVPGTVFAQVPMTNQFSTLSGVDGFTDIVTVPSSVVQRAYQSARQGGPSSFFYVRRFDDSTSPGFECTAALFRLGGRGAGVPFALTDVRVRWKKDMPVMAVRRGDPPPPFHADIHYNGTARLRGRWEIVLPGDPQPTLMDLLPQADLPIDQRGLQRRYTLIGRFDIVLPPTGHFILPSPDLSQIPHALDGLHLILMRVEASNDQLGSQNTEPIEGEVLALETGGTAGFPMPVLRFYVGSGSGADLDEIAELSAKDLILVRPHDHASIRKDEAMTFSWVASKGALLYRFEVDSDSGSVLSALVGPGLLSYSPPPWLRDRSGETLRWRVVALGKEGIPVAMSDWRDFSVKK